MRRLLRCLMSVAASFAALPAQAEVVQKSDAGFLIRHSIEVPADSWATWAALIAPAKWWAPEHTWSGKSENLYIDSQATGCFCELMPVPEGAPDGTRRGSVEHLHLIHVSPGKVLRMKGSLGPLQSEPADGVLTITLKSTPKGTRLLWEYAVGGYMRFKVDEIAPAVDKVLSEQVVRLGKLLGAEAKAPEAVKPGEEKLAEPAVDKPVDALTADFDTTIRKSAPAKPKAKPAAKKPATGN